MIAASGLVALLSGAGYLLFTRPHSDPLTKADAIIVLSAGDDIDDRIDYGLDLAKQGYADTVVLSKTLYHDDSDYRHACASREAPITVVCFVASPYTTRGEAIFVAELAKQRKWSHVIVVTWNYHILRARYIFHQCYNGTVTMQAVPRSYDYPVLQWLHLYAYQYGAFVKAGLLGCDSPD